MRERVHNIHVLYALTFVYNLAVALTAYINSTFLATFTGENNVGLIFTAGSLLSIVGLALIAPMLRRLGNYTITVILIVVSALSVLGLIVFDLPFVIALSFIIHLVAINLLWYTTDLLLEHFSQNNTTGRIRGAYLSISASAYVVAPVLAGFVLGADNYSRLYGLAALLFVLLLPTTVHNFNHYRDPVYTRLPFWKTLREMLSHKDPGMVFLTAFLLRFFYSWMVIYTPIYLHEHIGLSWSTIGITFTIMLLPFALLEYPLGRVADSKLGEKELMAVGFIILAFATAVLTLLSTSVWWVWALLLFATRVGASMVEVMSETYFFKKIRDGEANLLSFFRMVSPLAYVVGPLVASLVLYLTDMRFLFVILGIILLFGIPFSLKLNDTR